ncbi:RHS repeat-associated core domain-containing protein, partial [Actinacidiphila paucisporea]
DPQGTLNSMRTGGTSYYYLTDAQGSVVGLVNAAGTKINTYTYDPTGNARTTTQTTPQPYRFQGAYLDPTGLYKMGARYYDPTLARFTQTDPSGQETNPYAAFGGDPVNHTDPNGTDLLEDVVGGVSSILGGVGAISALYLGAPYAAEAAGLALGVLGVGVLAVAAGGFLIGYGIAMYT